MTAYLGAPHVAKKVQKLPLPSATGKVRELLLYKRKAKDEAPEPIRKDYAEGMTPVELAKVLREDYWAVIDACNWLATHEGFLVTHCCYPPMVCAPPEPAP